MVGEGVPESMYKIIEAMVGRAVSRCEQQGYSLEDFYRVMQEEQRRHPTVTLTQLFDKVFQHLQEAKN